MNEKTDFWSSRQRIAAAMLLVALSGVLLFTLRASQQTADSLDYALSARTGQGMFHPHHLLFIPLVRLSLQGLSALGAPPDPILAGQIHNLLWAMIAVLCLFLIAERLLSSTFGGLLAALFLLVARGFWLYSTQLEVYVPATGCLALLTAVLLLRPRRTFGTGLWVVLSILLALSVLYHQSNLFFCLPLGYWILRRCDGPRGRLLPVLALAGLLVLAGYVLAFHYTDVERRIPEILSSAQKDTLRGFLRFPLAYGFHPSPGWGTLSNVSVMGVGRLVHSQVRDLITFPWPLRFVVIPGFAAAMAGLVLWHTVQSARGAAHTPARRFLVIWLVTYDLFFLWWFPGEKEFFITSLFPLTLLAALAVKDLADRLGTRGAHRALARGVCLTLLGGVAAVNAAQTILPYHRDRGPAYAAALVLARRSPPGCLMIGDYTVGQNLRYYFQRERVWEAAMPLFYFYRDLLLPDRYRLAEEPCITADLSSVSPWFSLGGFDAQNHPEGWARYMKWLLGLERDSRSRGLSCRKFEGMGDIEGSTYLRLWADREPVDGIRQVFRRLDVAIGQSVGGDRPFETWLDSAPPHSFPEGVGGDS